jgi:hypothetical protein
MSFKDLEDRFAKLQKRFEDGTGQIANITLYSDQGVWIFSVNSLEFSATHYDVDLECAIAKVEKLVFADAFLKKAEEIKTQIAEEKKKHVQAEKEQESLFVPNSKDDKFSLN